MPQLNKSPKLNNKGNSSSNVNEVFKNSSFLNGRKKLVFLRMNGSTIIGVVGPPYPYCSLVAFCAFAWLRLCAFGAFGAFWCVQNLFLKRKANK